MDSLPLRTITRKCLVCGEEKLHTFDSGNFPNRHPSHACIDCIDTLLPIPQGKKRCPRCLAIHARKSNSYCHLCAAAYRRERYTPEKGRKWNLSANHRISSEEYDSMLLEQQGLCAVCGGPETTIDGYTKRPRSLAVDHNHSTGKIRRLLCNRCNYFLGVIESNYTLFKALMDYRERYQ